MKSSDNEKIPKTWITYNSFSGKDPGWGMVLKNNFGIEIKDECMGTIGNTPRNEKYYYAFTIPIKNLNKFKEFILKYQIKGVSIDCEEEPPYLTKLFAKAGKSYETYITNKERIKSLGKEYSAIEYLAKEGVRRFRRKMDGTIGSLLDISRPRSLDEIAKILVDIDIATNAEEAKEIVPKLVIRSMYFDNSFLFIKQGINFALEEITDQRDIKYKTEIWDPSASR